MHTNSICTLLISRFLWLSLLLSGSAYSDPASELFQNVIANANLCAHGKDTATRTDCYINAAPQKCEAEARKFLATHNQELFFCVSSCANAGVASRTFGGCSRDLDRQNAGSELAELKRADEIVALDFYWDMANKANAEALTQYPYLASPQTKTDNQALSSFEFLKKKYLTVNANPYNAVWAAANETNAWYLRVNPQRQSEAARQQSAAPITSEMADAILGSRPAHSSSNSHAICEFKQVMTNDDYKACGITPPTR